MSFAYTAGTTNTTTNTNRAFRMQEINNNCNEICGKFQAYYGSSTGTSYNPGDVLDVADVPGAVNLTIVDDNTIYTNCGACEADL